MKEPDVIAIVAVEPMVHLQILKEAFPLAANISSHIPPQAFDADVVNRARSVLARVREWRDL